MNFFRIAFFFSIIFQTLVSNAQERVLGTWKLFMPYGNSLAVCDAGDKIFSAAQKSIFSYEKNSGTIQIYDKASGLNDIGIQTINYDADTKTLVVAYVNSNIDLIINGTDVYNIPDIKNHAITGAITINGISFYNGNAYISTDIGISIINLARKEISNTYIIGASGGQVKVYATCVANGNIFAATDEGVKYAPVSSPNLQDFNMWTLYGAGENIPQQKATFIASLNDKVYAVIGANNCDTLFELNGNSWTKKYFDSTYTFSSLKQEDGSVYFSTWNTVNNSGKNGKINAADSLTVQDAQHARPVGWFESNGISWEGDAWGGLYKNNQGYMEQIAPDGPYSSNVSDITITDDAVYVATGGADESWGPEWVYDGFFVYKNNHWSVYNEYNTPMLDTFLSILSVAAVPGSDKVYLCSYLNGVAEYNVNDQSIKIYNPQNKNIPGTYNTLEIASNAGSDTRTSAICADKNGNIWIANGGATKPIKLIQPDGTWKEFAVPYTFQVMTKMLIDQNGQLWAPVRRPGGGMLVWNNNGTLDDPSDDVSKILLVGTGAGGLPDADVFCVAEDKDGNIWAGTNQGIGIFYCAASVLTSNGCDADQIKVERDGYVGYLFGTESVRAIAVDAANRKWVGTTNGLWLISADGKTELLKFTTDNSPLPSNEITKITIDKHTGEVWIGTTNGIATYQGDAIEECKDCDGALVYPNPVKPDYDGPIAIKGLADNAYVKITDVAGTLIFQGKANGTQMIWDGKGYNGVRAKSGVYLVFSSTDAGKEKQVAKILLLN